MFVQQKRVLAGDKCLVERRVAVNYVIELFLFFDSLPNSSGVEGTPSVGWTSLCLVFFG